MTTDLQPGTRVRIAERLRQHDWTDSAHMLRLSCAGEEAVIVARWPISIGRIGAAELYRVELDRGPTCYYYDDELTPVADPAEDLAKVRAALDAAQAELASLRAALDACRAHVDPEPEEGPAPEALLQAARDAARTFRVWNDLPDTFPTPEMLDALHSLADLLSPGVDCGSPDDDTSAPSPSDAGNEALRLTAELLDVREREARLYVMACHYAGVVPEGEPSIDKLDRLLGQRAEQAAAAQKGLERERCALKKLLQSADPGWEPDGVPMVDHLRRLLGDAMRDARPVRRLLEAHSAAELHQVAKGLLCWAPAGHSAIRSVAEVLAGLADLADAAKGRLPICDEPGDEPAPAPGRLAEALRACREWCDPRRNEYNAKLARKLRHQGWTPAAAALEALPEVVQAVAEIDDELRAGLAVKPGETVSLLELARRARLELLGGGRAGRQIDRLREQLCTLADVSPDEPAALGLALTKIGERLASCSCGPRRSSR